MGNRIAAAALIAAGALMLLSSCRSMRRELPDEEETFVSESVVEEPEIDYIDSMDQLVSGHVYVCHDDRYYLPVWGTCCFAVPSTGYSAGKTTWFTEDTLAEMPTLYEGDYLVYISDASFKESFVFDRYAYIGYSIGICNLKKTSSGRYSFDAVDGNANICSFADASRLEELNSVSCIIDTIGKTPLRSGNITSGGVILGLQKDQFYKTEVYVGTKLHTYTLKADVMAFTSMSSVSVGDYTFLRSQIIRLNIPEEFNTGYYSVNGLGLFRYVKGSSYSEDTDYNVPNSKISYSQRANDQQDIEGEDAENINLDFVVRREGDVIVSVTYDDDDRANFTYDKPVVKVIGEKKIYTITERSDNSFDEVIHLATGRYTLNITGMSGRAFEYSVLMQKEGLE